MNREHLQKSIDTVRKVGEGWRPPDETIAAAPATDGWHLVDRTDRFTLATEKVEQTLFWISGREKLALTIDGWRQLGPQNITATDIKTTHAFVNQLNLAWLDRQEYLDSGGDPLGYDTSDMVVCMRQQAADALAGRNKDVIKAEAAAFRNSFR